MTRPCLRCCRSISPQRTLSLTYQIDQELDLLQLEGPHCWWSGWSVVGEGKTKHFDRLACVRYSTAIEATTLGPFATQSLDQSKLEKMVSSANQARDNDEKGRTGPPIDISTILREQRGFIEVQARLVPLLCNQASCVARSSMYAIVEPVDRPCETGLRNRGALKRCSVRSR